MFGWLAMILMMGGALSPVSQTPDSGRSLMFTLVAHDASGMSHTIRLGVAEGATYGFDTWLEEVPMPPSPPPPIFDFRFLDLPGRPRIPQTGSYADIRPWPSPSRVDTFHIRCQPMDDRYPLRILFDAGLRSCVDSLIVLHGSDARRLLPDDLIRAFVIADSPETIMLHVHWQALDLRDARLHRSDGSDK